MSCRKFIVIDDDPTNNLICEFIIRKFHPDADVRVFTEPEKGLLHVENVAAHEEQQSHFVLFLDINMPTMTGWEFLDSFIKMDAATTERFKIFMLSSSVEDFFKEAAKYPFVLDFFSKPLTNTLLERVEEQTRKMDNQ